MALRDEQADILGGPILQRPESGAFAVFSQYHVVFKSVTLLGLALFVWIACARGFEHLRKNRELRYRKAMRRKHGIPDSDCRPFAVAYAAAKRAHLEREAQDRKKTTNNVSYHNPPAVDQRTNAQKDACLRRRVPETTVQHHDHHHPINHAAVNDKKPPEVPLLDLPDRYNPNPRRRAALPVDSPHLLRTIRRDLVLNLDDNEESRKRCFEDESDVEHETIKKSRIDGDELIDGDEQADWYAQYSDKPSPRVRKESLDRHPEGNYVQMNGQEMFKHVDDLRNEDHEHDEAMEGIDEDEVTELKAVLRGKKRDRAEAGSTFGGDDEEDIRNGRASHHRKRRTILQRKIEVPPRGQKRDRETESPESEGEGIDSETPRRRAQRSPKKKRGKKDKSEDILVEDPRVSKDPLCGGRRVGEGWEADGVQYKVGEKGERLRLTLVKKARNKYHMPQDSQHPDRSAALDIYVEMWLTEGQYRQAEGKQELVWQETSRESSVSKTPDVPDSPTKNGKNLLWDSVKCSPARRPFRRSILPGTLIRVNPFEQWQPQPVSGRRVASSSTFASPILPGVADSPTRPGFRAFSKWEKQDREAEAMARIRAKIEEEKKAQAPPRKSAGIPSSVTAPELGTKPPAVPIITLTPAPTVAAEGKSDDSSAQSKTNTPGFSLSSCTASKALPSTLLPNPPTAPTTTTSTSSLSPFSLVKPPQVPSSTSAIPSSSAMPNIFGKVVGESTPTSSTFSPSTPGVTTEPKAVPFSFAKPEVSSSTLSPAVGAAPTSKPPVSTVSTAFKSFPSPLTFASGAAATKAEIPISAPATATESSKPAAPHFSFPAASASSSTAATATSSAPSMPKFSFGQPTTAGATSQAKPTFKFGQTQPSASGGAFAVPAADESKKSGIPASALGAAASSNEPTKPPSFGAAFVFGNPSHAPQPASATSLFGKPVAMDGDSLTSTSPKPTLAFAPASATPFDHATSATPAASTSGSTPIFPLSGTNSGSRSAEGFKPTTTYGGSNPASLFGGNPTDGKPAFAFGAPADGSQPKPPSIFGSSAEGSQRVFTFGGTAEAPKATVVSSGAVEAPKATFPFGAAVDTRATSGPATESSKPTNTTDPSKPTPFTRNTAFAPLSANSAFAFGKDDAAPNVSTSVGTSTQAKPTAPFTFAPSGTSGSIFGQPSSFGTSSDSVFGKSTSSTPNTFGFAGTGGSSSSNAFTFGKPTTQNQKQEQ